MPSTKKTQIDKVDEPNTSFLSHKRSRGITSVLEIQEHFVPKKPKLSICETSSINFQSNKKTIDAKEEVFLDTNCNSTNDLIQLSESLSEIDLNSAKTNHCE
jgi:hypothetical protein